MHVNSPHINHLYKLSVSKIDILFDSIWSMKSGKILQLCYRLKFDPFYFNYKRRNRKWNQFVWNSTSFIVSLFWFQSKRAPVWFQSKCAPSDFNPSKKSIKNTFKFFFCFFLHCSLSMCIVFFSYLFPHCIVYQVSLYVCAFMFMCLFLCYYVYWFFFEKKNEFVIFVFC